MNLVINIVLLLFCIGVAYSSPANISSSDGTSHTVKPTVALEVQPDHIKHQTSLPTQNSSTSQSSQSVTPLVFTVANSAIKVEPVTAESKSKPLIIDTIDKNATAKAKNTSAVLEVMPKHENTTSTNQSVPDETKTSTQKITVTATAATLASTAAPIVSKSDHAIPTPATQERQFDGPSFVGGIVLTVGLTVIGFIAFKFYKSGKIERNYRTL